MDAHSRNIISNYSYNRRLYINMKIKKFHIVCVFIYSIVLLMRRQKNKRKNSNISHDECGFYIVLIVYDTVRKKVGTTH